MQTVGIQNFKSYQQSIVHKFHPQINVILGSNGRGKSNFFSALLFLLSNKTTLSSAQWSHILFRGVDGSNDNGISVQSLITAPAQNQQQQNIPLKTIKLARTWKNDHTQEYYVNGKFYTKDDYQSYIELLGFRFQNPYNIVQQGKIIDVSKMSPNQLFGLLKQATGFKNFSNKMKQAKNRLNQIQKDKKDIIEVLEQLKRHVNTMEDKKAMFELMAIQQKANKLRKKKYYEEKITKLQNQKNLSIETCDELFEKLQNIRQNQSDLKKNYYHLKEEVKIINQKIMHLIQEDQMATDYKFNKIQSQEIEDKNKEAKKIKKELKKIQLQVNKINENIKAQRQQFEILQYKYESLKNGFAVSKNNVNKQQLIQGMKNYIKERQNMMKQTDKELQKINRMKTQFNVKDIYQKQYKEWTKNKQIQENLQFQIKQRKINLIDLFRKKAQSQAQLEIIKSHKHQLSIKFRSLLNNIDPVLYETLQRQNLPGVYGFLIDFLTIDQNLLFAYQLADLDKLCTLIVQDQTALQRVIQLNKKIKGKSINILPLSFTRRSPLQKKNYPKSQSATPLISQDFIKVYIDRQNPQYQNFPSSFEADVTKLIKNVYGRFMITEDYRTGMSISKQYHLTCITGDRQIIYSQGTLCKLGREQKIHQPRISYLSKYRQKMNEEKFKRDFILGLNEDIKKNQQQESNLNKKLKDTEINGNIIKRRLAQIVQNKKTYERLSNQQLRLLDEKSSIQQNINKKSEQIKSMEQKKNIQINQTQYQKVQNQYILKKNKLNESLKILEKLELEYQKLIKRDEDMNQLAQYQQRMKAFAQKQQNSRLSPFLSAQQMADKLNKQVEKKQKEINQIQKQLQQLNEQFNQVQNQKSYINQKNIIIQNRKKDIRTKLNQIGSIQENLQELQQRSNSISINHSMRQQLKSKKVFAVRDQLILAKYHQILTQYKNHKKQYQDLIELENKIIDVFNQYDKQGQDCLEKYLEKFKAHFHNIFSRIVDGGKTDVKFKSKKIEGQQGIFFQNSLDIRVNFRSQGNLQKWQHFSGGQRTVISLSIIMALQKCQPAPFYVFDEIDAALDRSYLQKVLNLIIQESRYAQYFITSFKKQILEMPQEISSYFLVKYENRKSDLVKIKKRDAEIELNAIINQ